MIWHVLTAILTAVVAAWLGWQSATRHHARRLRDHRNFYGANLLDPNGEEL